MNFLDALSTILACSLYMCLYPIFAVPISGAHVWAIAAGNIVIADVIESVADGYISCADGKPKGLIWCNVINRMAQY